MAETLEQAAPIRLDGRGIVILGAGGGGIGTIAARILAAAGARLLCVDISDEQAKAVAQQVGGEAYVADITDRQQMEKLFAHAVNLFGDSFYGVADIVGYSPGGAMEDNNDEVIERTFNLNFRHAFLTVQIAAPILAKCGGGSLVFVSSLSGSRATPNQGTYSVAKGALEQLIRQAAFEYGGRGVRVNGVAPGLTMTPGVRKAIDDRVAADIAATIPMNKLATAQDQANSIYFLLSDLAAHVSGTIIHVDGAQMTQAGLPELSGGRTR